MIPGPGFQQAMTEEWHRCAAEGAPLAVLLAALDQGFAGDDAEVSAQLDRALRVHCARTRDRVLPLRPGVFIAILPHTTPAGTQHVGEQVVESMHVAPSPAATVSVGVAVTVPSGPDDSTLLLHRAERALRAARSRGGDGCVGGAPTPPPSGGPLESLRKILPTTTKAPDKQRGTD